MSTKEKLDLLWKYLVLIVIAILGLRFTENINSEYISNNDDIVAFGDNVPILDDNNLNVEVKKEIVDGDTVMNVIVNGKELDSLEFNQSFNDMVSWKSKDGKKRILKMKKTIRIDDMDVDLETDIDEVIKKYINKPSKD